MKNLYTAIITGTALLLATAGQAQHTAHGKLAHRLLSVGQHGPVLQGEQRGGGPTNDDCGSVTAENLNIGGSVNFTGSTAGATDVGDYEAGSQLDGEAPSVWHAFTMSDCADVTVSYCGTDPVFGNAWIVLATSCPASALVFNNNFDQTTCSDGNLTIRYLGLAAGTYYMPVMLDTAVANGPYTISVSAAACPVAPANDACSGAIALTAGVDCIGTPFTTMGATQDMEPIECGGYTSTNANDVFFTFVATATDMTVGVTGFNQADPMVELFEGSCASPSSLACADATFPQSAGQTTSEQLIQSGLTVGTTYIVRVYDWGHTSPEHNFEICVTEGSGNNIGIEENPETSFSLYPNPGTGIFSLSYSGSNGLANIEVMDVAGRVAHSVRERVSKGSVLPLDLSAMSAGNYSVRLTVNGVRTEQRLMVK